MTLHEFIAARCEPCGDCLLWKGCTTNGYGQINTVRFGRGCPHQLLWIAEHGAYDTTRLRLVNTCGSRRCCNIEHWRLLKVGQVIRQQYRKRQRGSEDRIYRAGLKGAMKRTDLPGNPDKAAEARAMRDAGHTVVQIAAHFGVSRPTAQRWAAGTSYRPVTPWAI